MPILGRVAVYGWRAEGHLAKSIRGTEDVLKGERTFPRMTAMLLECKHCEAVVDAALISQYDEDEDRGMPGATWYFCKCPRCTSAMLAVSEFFDEGPPGRVYPTAERRQLGGAVPKSIQEAFEEAVVCLKAKAFTASAIMCRKTLEGLCDAHGAKIGNLSKRLAKLQSDGIIDKSLYEWAEALRIFGNEAAHGVDTKISRSDCEDILEFTEALAQYVFTYRDKFAKFKARQAARENGSAEDSTDES